VKDTWVKYKNEHAIMWSVSQLSMLKCDLCHSCSSPVKDTWVNLLQCKMLEIHSVNVWHSMLNLKTLKNSQRSVLLWWLGTVVSNCWRTSITCHCTANGFNIDYSCVVICTLTVRNELWPVGLRLGFVCLHGDS